MTARALLPHRDRLIYQSFGALSLRELAAQHGLTVRQIRRIIDKQRALTKAPEQKL